MTTLHTVSFQKTVLASLIGLCLSQSAFALQEISDKDLSQATGEGIAFLPQDMAFVFRGAGADETTATIVADRTKDTGYIHYLPVGGLTSIAQDTNKDGKVDTNDHSVGKADLYLYGLSVSKNSSNDPNSRLDADPLIRSWGSAANPWLFKAATAKNVPNFNTASTCSNVSDTTCQVTFLNFEAPLYETTLPTDGSVDAYNLKLALWADAFVRDQSKPEGDADQFKLGQMFSSTQTLAEAAAGGRANRLRLQGIWNGFGVNGSNLQIFQTLNGATNAGGMSPFYNNTLGMSGVFRFNSGAADSLRAAVTAGSKTRYSADGEGRVYNSTTQQYDAVSNGINTGGVDGYTNRYSTVYIGNAGGTNGRGDSSIDNLTASPYTQYRLRTKDTVDVVTTGTWTLPTGLYDKVLRLSTAECDGTKAGYCNGYNNLTQSGILDTPALNASVNAPRFDPDEGIFIYNPNINLVLGSLYQPVILGSDGKNFSLEIARIPNKQEIYSRIYTRYAGDTGDSGVTYYGSTCNVYQCGSSDITGYQGGSVREDYSAAALSGKKLATHSSISIGSVYSPDGGNTLQAFKGSNTQDAVGISFGKLTSTSSTSRTDYYYQLQAQYRQRKGSENRWEYSSTYNNTTGAWGNFINGTSGCNTNWGNNNTCYQFNSILGNNWANVTTFNPACISDTSVNAICGGVGAAYYNRIGSTSGTAVNLGYAPDAAHPSYTAGLEWSNANGWSVNNATGCPGTNPSQPCIPTAQRFVVNAWGGGTPYQNPTTTAQTDAQKKQNILNAYGVDYAGSKWTSNLAPDFNSISVTNVPLNNFGSAVIDGMLIQHLKITTKGL